MNANQRFLKFAGLVLVAAAGPIAAFACSSSSGNAAPSEPVLEGGPEMDSTTTPGDEGGSSGSSSSGASSGSSNSGSSSGSGSGSSGSGSGGADASAVCDPSATVGGSNSYNTCSSFGCAGKYDNAAHHVPSPLPTPP